MCIVQRILGPYPRIKPEDADGEVKSKRQIKKEAGMKKRIREIGSVALAAILLLAGCGSGASEANQTSSNQAASVGDAQMQDKGEGNQKIGGK